jgi:hypothetical protein
MFTAAALRASIDKGEAASCVFSRSSDGRSTHVAFMSSMGSAPHKSAREATSAVMEPADADAMESTVSSPRAD